MVRSELHAVIAAMTPAERLELVEFIETTLETEEPRLSAQQETLVRARAAELDADPALGLTWDQLDQQMGERWR